LGYRGLGDERAAPLISIIDALPAIKTINLCDNRLTDVTLVPLMSKLLSLKALTYLDLSFNKVDDAAEVLMEFLKDKHCKLHVGLILCTF